MSVRNNTTAKASVSTGVEKPILTGKSTLKRQPTERPNFTLDDIKRVIGPDLFERPWHKSFYYLGRDIFLVVISMFLSLFLNQIAAKIAFGFSGVLGLDTSALEAITGAPKDISFPTDITESVNALFSISFSSCLNSVAVTVYSVSLILLTWAYVFFTGCFMTGLWIIGHECGHRAFSSSILINDTVGWVIHSFLLVPYFSWQISHRRHHSNTGNQNMDEAHMVPHIDDVLPSAAREHGADYAPGVEKAVYNGYVKNVTAFLKEVNGALAESFFINRLILMVLYCLTGFWLYLFANLSGRKYPKTFLPPNHFLPNSPIYSPSERILVIASDIGLIGILYCLYKVVEATSFKFLFIMYVIPYLIVNYFFVAFTFLHHTHIALPHYSQERYNFLQGALSTIDREWGWFYANTMHEIMRYHVVHHLFSYLPFYHAAEATERMIPLLGDYYTFTDEDNVFLGHFRSTWKAINDCAFISEDNHKGLTLAHEVIEQSRKINGKENAANFKSDDPKFVELVESKKEAALAADPHANGRNTEAEVYWYRTVNY